MKGKLVFVTGAAVGYVLGARAGRKRYEQIKAGADKFWNSPTVQKRVEQVQGFVDDHAPDVQSRVTDSAKRVVGQVTKRTSQKRSPDTGSSASTGGTTASGGTIPGTSQSSAAGDQPPFE